MGDIRISTAWRNHHKRVKLERRLGKEAVLALIYLWCWCADNQGRTTGDLAGMDDDDIAIAAGYTGDAAAFVLALCELRLLDGAPGAYRVHDYQDAQPWVAATEQRSRVAKSKAHERWAREGRCHGGTEFCDDRCPQSMQDMPNDAEADSAYAQHAGCNAPTPKPSPKPSPNKRERPNPGSSPEVEKVTAHYLTKFPQRVVQARSKKNLEKIQARLTEGYTVTQLCTAIDNIAGSSWHQENGQQNLELVVRDAAQVDKYVSLVSDTRRKSKLTFINGHRKTETHYLNEPKPGEDFTPPYSNAQPASEREV